MNDSILSISPFDGRYKDRCIELSPVFSEYGFIKNRIQVEIKWLINLAANKDIGEIKTLSAKQQKKLNKIWQDFSIKDSKQIKSLEKEMLHDMKAAEVWMSKKLQLVGLGSYAPFLHFGCTSEDINNICYGLMIKQGRNILQQKLQTIHQKITSMAHEYAKVPMTARTHGQPASPTTLGKEMAVFSYRLWKQLQSLNKVEIYAKFNGATGNYNSWHLVYPNINWRALNKKFVESFGLMWNPYSTQIESHDKTVELLHSLVRVNMILVDMSRDLWAYISLNYFVLRKYDKEVGSSTMPHKINPEKFENSEGNLEFASSSASFLAMRLPLSRWQRDLSDSTLQRNLGTVFAQSLLGYDSFFNGIERLEANQGVIEKDIKERWQLLTEGVQTMMRQAGRQDAYDIIKRKTRGAELTEEDYKKMIAECGFDEEDKQILLKLKPYNYTGLASILAKDIHKYCK